MINMRSPNSTESYKNFWEASIGAACGFYLAVTKEKKIGQVFTAMTASMIICAIADVGYFEILMVIFSWVLALICEIFNTAIEKVLDYTSGREFHPLVKQGKDYAAACTFVAIVFAGILSSIILWNAFLM